MVKGKRNEADSLKMPGKLSTTVSKIKTDPCQENEAIVTKFCEFLNNH
jgi:hypothetical protein